MNKKKNYIQYQFEPKRDLYDYFHAEKYVSTGYFAHFHRNAELYCVYEGNVHVTIDNEEYNLEAGDAVFINSLKVHCYDCSDAKIGFVLFGSKYLQPFYEIYSDKEIPALLLNKSFNQPIFDYLDRIAHKKNCFTPLESYAATYSLLSLIARSYDLVPASVQKSKRRAEISDIIQYIYANSNQNLSLTSIADTFHYDPLSLSHMFAKYIKSDIRNFINDIRIQNFIAMRTLPENKHKSSIELALLCGFNSAATFYRAYKKFNKEADD